MAFLNAQDQLRKIQWAHKYLWDVKLEGAPSPFDQFFPAVEIEEPRASVETQVFQRYLTSIEIPMGSKAKRLQMTIADGGPSDDSQNNMLLEWLDDWMNRTILQSGSSITPVSQIIKKLTVAKLNSKREQISIISYNIFPAGDLVYAGNSSSEGQLYSMSFVVVGSDFEQKKRFNSNDL